MGRQRLLDAIKGAGAEGNQPLFLRLYAENRIAYHVALEAYRSGVAWAKKMERTKMTETVKAETLQTEKCGLCGRVNDCEFACTENYSDSWIEPLENGDEV